jgi:hypothetical protein
MSKYALKKYVFNLLSFSIPNLILLTYSIPELKSFVKSLLSKINLYAFFNQYKVVIILVFLVPVPFIISKLESDYEYNSNKVNISILQKLLLAIENIINEKRRRFQQEVNINRKSKEEIFLAITKPKTQITHILTNMTAFFSQITDDNTIKGSLISCKDKQLKNFFIQTDDLPKVSIDDLIKYNSLAKSVLDSGKIMIENDTSRSKIFWNNSGTTSIKSIICYPIFNGNHIDFILSITSKNTGCFKKFPTEQLKWLLTQFEHRICVENHLLQLRGEE